MKGNKRVLLAVFLVALTVVVACSGGGGGDTSATNGNPSNGNSSTGEKFIATAVRNTAPVSACPNGGISVDAGIDTNGNGVLDSSEVTSTQYVCNGANGSNATSILVLVTAESAGSNCVYGGQSVNVGTDTNGNNVLDSSEITSTKYICNGATGQSGTSGSNGINTLVSISPESAGSNCTNGGQKICSGPDSNNNNILDAGEIVTTTYVCNGATGSVGPGITWVNVTGTSVQAVSNTGYIANNATSPVTITLPASPALGDIVEVTGSGAGGWKMAQNAGQSITTMLESDFTTSHGAKSVASSADGTKLVAAEYGGKIYTSTDSGTTWTARDSSRDWVSVASSSDGTKLVATEYGGSQIYTSVDSGATWTTHSQYTYWAAVASSADGTKLVVADWYYQIYTSLNSGATWTARDSSRYWSAVASSSDGTKLVAAEQGGFIYTSLNSGATWTSHDSSRNWYGVASSSDGTKLVAVVNGGQIYTSTDSGLNWTAGASSSNWVSVASSSDGTKLVAADNDGQVYVSSNSGKTWNGYISTTTGTAGSISGGQYTSIELQYAGNNKFTILGHEGNLTVW